MKANEFVKKHGWDAVINAVKSTNAEETAAFESKDLDPILAKNGSVIGFNVKIHAISYLDVKRLVESYELVMDYYGLTRAKEHAESNYTAPELKAALKQAIADVEACGKVGS